jgi:hypothetical protein
MLKEAIQNTRDLEELSILKQHVSYILFENFPSLTGSILASASICCIAMVVTFVYIRTLIQFLVVLAAAVK